MDEFPDFAVTDMMLGGVGVPNQPHPPPKVTLTDKPSHRTPPPRVRKTTKTMSKVTSAAAKPPHTTAKAAEDSHGDARGEVGSEVTKQRNHKPGPGGVYRSIARSRWVGRTRNPTTSQVVRP